MDAVKNYGLLGLAVLCAALGIYLGSTGAKGYDLMAFLAGGVFFCAQIVTVDIRKGILAAAVLATGANGYLLYSKFSEAAYSACMIDAYWDCSKVNSLPESELFGVPVTLLGVGFYVGLGLASLGGKERTPRFEQVTGLLAIPALIFSVWLGWVAISAKAGCIMCITIYACNVILLWAALKGLKQSGKGLFEGVDKVFGTSSLWVTASVFALITLVGTSSWRSRKQAQEIPAPGEKVDIEELKTYYTKPGGTIQVDGTEPRLGKSDAPITIVEFADYGCPHCAQAAPMLKQFVRDTPEVTLLFKAFPLSGVCNPVMQGEEGVERCKAAMAAECAGDQSRYYEMSAMLFKNLEYRSDEDLAFMAKEIGLDFDRWVGCMQEPGTIEAVVADARAGAEARIQGTPSMFVNGLVDGEWVEITKGPPALFALVEAKLSGNCASRAVISLTIDGLRRNLSGAVSGALWSVGATGVQEDWLPGTAPPPRQPWDQGPEAPLPERIRLVAWFDHPDRAAILALLQRWLDASCSLSWAEQPAVDWQQRYLDSLIRIELPGLTLSPPHLAEPGDLIIEPGCGFGTGEHPTTRQMLEMLPAVTGQTLLDIGAGSGVLALAAARNGFVVHGTEIDEAARRNALHNADLNGLKLTIDARQPDELEPVDVVLANIHAELLVGFAPELTRLARNDLLLAGIMAEKAPTVRAAFPHHTLHDRRDDGTWVALHLKP